jgi:hypothetical protein
MTVCLNGPPVNYVDDSAITPGELTEAQRPQMWDVGPIAMLAWLPTLR